MKKNILSLSAMALVLGALFTACNKEDTTAPVVTLTGDASKTVSLQGTYTEEGATATDDEDGEVTPTVSGTVNVNLAGTYTITYTATDAAGNVGTATRTVIVKNDAEDWAGNYSVVDVCGTSTFNYNQTVTASTTVNNKLMFSKFADYAGNTAIYAMVTGSDISIPSQSAVGIGTNNGGTCDVANHQFVSQSGMSNSNGFVITYTDELTGPGACTAAAASCTATFTKM
ncbi:MAG: DUF5011 domain-containing protein [Bacteroidia bacterium]